MANGNLLLLKFWLGLDQCHLCGPIMHQSANF